MTSNKSRNRIRTMDSNRHSQINRQSQLKQRALEFIRWRETDDFFLQRGFVVVEKASEEESEVIARATDLFRVLTVG